MQSEVVRVQIGVPKKVRVSSLISSEELLKGEDIETLNQDEEDGSASSGSARPPSVIETISRHDTSPLGADSQSSSRDLIDAVGDNDDELSDDDTEEDEDDSLLDSDTDGEGTTTSSEGDEVEVFLRDETSEPGAATEEIGAAAQPSPTVRVNSLINNAVGASLKDAMDKSTTQQDTVTRESPLPVFKALLFVLLLPVCSYVLKEATSITRDVCLDFREKGIIESMFLVHLMLGLNIFFSVSVFLAVVAVFLDPSKLGRFVASLDSKPFHD